MVKLTVIFVGQILLILAIAGASIYCVIKMINCCCQMCTKKKTDELSNDNKNEESPNENKEDIEENKEERTILREADNSKVDYDFNQVVDFYEPSYDEKEKKVKEYFENLLSKEFEVRLYVMDPRINWFKCYANLTEEEINKVLEVFPNCRIEMIKNKIGEYKRICSKYFMVHLGFEINVVDDSIKDKLIEYEYQEHLRRKEARKDVIY